MDNDLDPPMINTLSRDILQFPVHIGTILLTCITDRTLILDFPLS